MALIDQKRYILTEVATNNNKFWEIDIYDDGNVITRWARVGYTPQSKTFRHAGRGFFDRKCEEKEKKGYTLLKTIGGSSNFDISRPNNTELRKIATQQIVRNNDPILTKLINRFVKSNIHRITSSTQIKFNSSTGLFSTPLGIVTLSGINEARSLLAKLKGYIENRDWTSYNVTGTLSNYLRIIPQNVGMRLDVKELLPDLNSIQSQSNILDSLESSYKAFESNKSDNNNIPKTEDIPVEEVFKVDLEILNDDREINKISDWFHKSNHRTHGYSNVKINTFLKIKIHDNWNNFNEKLGNPIEVWHGTSEPNLLSILKTGLKVSPPSTTAITGKMFGQGHYGAVDSSKSMQYTFGRFNGQCGDSGWLFIAYFAMGRIYYANSYGNNGTPSGYNSIWAKRNNTGLRFDELIVPKDNQVRLKYLIEIK